MSRALLIAISLGFSAVGCGGGAAGGGAEKAGGDSKAAAEAKTIWDTRCVTCHGASGTGDGAAAASLDPKPRSFKDHKWQSETDDDKIKKVIVEGGPAAGLAATMAPNPDLKDKPEVVAELVKTIRGFK